MFNKEPHFSTSTTLLTTMITTTRTLLCLGLDICMFLKMNIDSASKQACNRCQHCSHSSLV